MKKSSSASLKQNQKSTMESKSNGFLSTYNAEIGLLLHTMTTLAVFLVSQNFIMEQVCLVNLEYSEEVCTALNTNGRTGNDYQEEEVEVQKLVGSIMILRMVLENIFPLFLVILIGAWSDKYGQKLPMLFVVASFIIQNVLLLICVYFKSMIGGWTIGVVTSLIPGLSGNNACFNMAVFSFVVGNVPIEKRTARTGVAHSMIFLGITLGLGFGGVLSGNLTIPQVFILGLILEIGIFFFINYSIDNHKNQSSKPFIQIILDIFTIQHLKDAFSVIKKQRVGNTRRNLFILLVAHFCAFASIMGEMSVYFLFGRYKFNWDGSQMGFFLTYKTVIGFIGNFLVMGLLSQRLKLSDPVIGIFGSLSTLVASIYYASIEQSYLMYFGPVLAILGGGSMIVPRSILSKIIPTHEIGKVNSFLGFIDSISPLVAGPIYTMIYTNTFQVFPGSFFLISILLTIPPILGHIYFLTQGVKELKQN